RASARDWGCHASSPRSAGDRSSRVENSRPRGGPPDPKGDRTLITRKTCLTAQLQAHSEASRPCAPTPHDHVSHRETPGADRTSVEWSSKKTDLLPDSLSSRYLKGDNGSNP